MIRACGRRVPRRQQAAQQAVEQLLAPPFRTAAATCLGLWRPAPRGAAALAVSSSAAAAGPAASDEGAGPSEPRVGAGAGAGAGAGPLFRIRSERASCFHPRLGHLVRLARLQPQGRGRGGGWDPLPGPAALVRSASSTARSASHVALLWQQQAGCGCCEDSAATARPAGGSTLTRTRRRRPFAAAVAQACLAASAGAAASAPGGAREQRELPVPGGPTSEGGRRKVGGSPVLPHCIGRVQEQGWPSVGGFAQRFWTRREGFSLAPFQGAVFAGFQPGVFRPSVFWPERGLATMLGPMASAADAGAAAVAAAGAAAAAAAASSNGGAVAVPGGRPARGTLPSRPARVVVRDPEGLKRKKAAMRLAGKEKIQVIADFDRTLTRYQVNGERGLSSHALVEQDDPVYNQRRDALLQHYYPKEVDPTIPAHEKAVLMEEWWSKSHDLMVEGGLSLQAISNSVAKAHNTQLREGTVELLTLLEKLDIPVLIFSAGLADVIEEVLRQRLPRFFKNVRVVSNRMQFDKHGQLIGFEGRIIHVLNKNEHALEMAAPLHEQAGGAAIVAEGVGECSAEIRRHTNVILLGDHLGDLGMSEGVQLDNRIAVGFLNDDVERQLGLYAEAFDIVILDDGPITVATDLVKSILGNDSQADTDSTNGAACTDSAKGGACADSASQNGASKSAWMGAGGSSG